MGGRCFSSVDDLEEGSVERAEPHVLIVVVCLIGALLLMDYWVISGWTSDDGLNISNLGLLLRNADQ